MAIARIRIRFGKPLPSPDLKPQFWFVFGDRRYWGYDTVAAAISAIKVLVMDSAGISSAWQTHKRNR
jgi:hypothetical protein